MLNFLHGFYARKFTSYWSIMKRNAKVICNLLIIEVQITRNPASKTQIHFLTLKLLIISLMLTSVHQPSTFPYVPSRYTSNIVPKYNNLEEVSSPINKPGSYMYFPKYWLTFHQVFIQASTMLVWICCPAA